MTMNTSTPLKAANAARLQKSMDKRVRLASGCISTVRNLIENNAVAYRVRIIENGLIESHGFILRSDLVDGEADYVKTDVYGMAKMCFDHLEGVPMAVMNHDNYKIDTAFGLDHLFGE